MSAADCKGRTIWIVDAHRDTGKRFVVRSDERLAAFLELESVIRGCGNCLDKQADFFQTRRPQTDLNQAEEFSPPSSSPPPDLQSQNQHGGENRKRIIHEPIDSAKTSSSSIFHLVGLLRPFADNAGSESATR